MVEEEEEEEAIIPLVQNLPKKSPRKKRLTSQASPRSVP